MIIPTFNSSAYIAETLASVLSQTYAEIEVIVVDDASSDRTVDAVKAFADQRIKLVRHGRNRGPGAARNTGMAAAQGRWVAFVDSDDQMKADRVEKLVAAIADAGEGFFVADDE
ncbi:MAG: glycosyltransferase family 2 protein [Firmicutes bacterium]|nr:glycosyltransferase family 2 protein [Bacillota bacterium]